MLELVHAEALYELGAVPPELGKVTVNAPAVVVDGVTVTLAGALTWLVAFWGPTYVVVDAK
jgi:uncharacterized membrane protein